MLGDRRGHGLEFSRQLLDLGLRGVDIECSIREPDDGPGQPVTRIAWIGPRTIRYGTEERNGVIERRVVEYPIIGRVRMCSHGTRP